MNRLKSLCQWLFMSVMGAVNISVAVFTFTVDLLAFLTHERSASQHLCDAITHVFRSLSAHRDEQERYLENGDPLAFFFRVCLGLIPALLLLILGPIVAAAASAISLVVDFFVVVFSRKNNGVAKPPPPAINFEDLPGNKLSGSILMLLFIIYSFYFGGTNRKVGEFCRSDANCMSGLSCHNWDGCTSQKCIQTTVTNPFNTIDTSLPFNKYAFLTTHNSFSITGVTRFTFYNQEDSVTDQLKNGVRALMLDVYDFRDDIWLCHSFGIFGWTRRCYDLTAFEPAINALKEVEVFLMTNPSEIVTLILEDHVSSHKGLTKLFNKADLGKYWFPVQNMPQNGEDWPIVSDMIKHNHRLLVFTSNRSKESTEGIAYQWNYMVENQYGDDGMNPAACNNRSESSFLGDRTKSLIFINYFPTTPHQGKACMEHSRGLVGVLHTCYAVAGNRWANFLAVDYYKRSDGGGVFQATDRLNGKLICGRDDVRACRKGILKHAFKDLLLRLGLTWKEAIVTGSGHGGAKAIAQSVMSAEEKSSPGKKEDPESNLKEEKHSELNLGVDEFRDEL